MAARSLMTAEIWSLNVEIFRLLTGEAYPGAQPGDHVTITVSAPPSVKPDRHALRKILEASKKITELLIGEMDSLLEAKAESEAEPVTKEMAVGGDLWSDVKKESYGVTPGRSPLGEYGDGETDARSNMLCEESSHVIGADPRDAPISIVKLEEEEHVFVKIKEEEIPLQIGQEGRYTWNTTEEYAANLLHGEREDDLSKATTGAPITPDPHPALPPEYLSSHHSTPSGHHIGSLPQTTAQKSKKPHACSVCGKCFSQKCDLAKHERVHTGEKPYPCTQCGKCFSRKLHLTIHERIHTGEKPYSCSACEKSFSSKSNLITHERIHTGEKPYSCPVCKKCFSHKSHLITHERVHTGEKPYACSECGKRFCQKLYLITHKRAHTGEKPFSCPDCGKGFSQNFYLMAHMRVHTGEKPYSCSECGRCFPYRSALSRHARLHME